MEDEDEEEVLEILATQLSGLINFVGGKDFAQVLLNPLKKLLAAEQTKVRDKVLYFK